jgi:hypothetical protein
MGITGHLMLANETEIAALLRKPPASSRPPNV